MVMVLLLGSLPVAGYVWLVPEGEPACADADVATPVGCAVGTLSFSDPDCGRVAGVYRCYAEATANLTIVSAGGDELCGSLVTDALDAPLETCAKDGVSMLSEVQIHRVAGIPFWGFAAVFSATVCAWQEDGEEQACERWRKSAWLRPERPLSRSWWDDVFLLPGLLLTPVSSKEEVGPVPVQEQASMTFCGFWHCAQVTFRHTQPSCPPEGGVGECVFDYWFEVPSHSACVSVELEWAEESSTLCPEGGEEVTRTSTMQASMADVGLEDGSGPVWARACAGNLDGWDRFCVRWSPVWFESV